MRKAFFLCVIFFFSTLPVGAESLLMATTTSTDNTGLLDKLIPIFSKDTGLNLNWIAVGTGRALKMGQNCDVDILMVHAPMAEKRFVKNGYGIKRKEFMYNDFIVVGPEDDPAGLEGLSLERALKIIVAKKAVFVSRGDDSGTNKKEKYLWKYALNFEPDKESWYIQTGQGMLSTLNIAAVKKGYTLTDRGTFIKYSSKVDGNSKLKIAVEGDKLLRNQYSVMIVNPKKCDKVKLNSAITFLNWVTSRKAQKFIGNFRLMGKQLFIPNAK